jgi:hypothetical protein
MNSVIPVLGAFSVALVVVIVIVVPLIYYSSGLSMLKGVFVGLTICGVMLAVSCAAVLGLIAYCCS